MEIKLNAINLKYGDKSVLANMSEVFMPGQTSVVVGPNGAGKTSLLKLIRGAASEISGDICFNKKRFCSAERIKNSNIHYLSADAFAGFSYLTVRENFFCFLSGRDYSNEQVELKWQGYSQALGLEPFQNTRLSLCSMGERQAMKLAVHLADDRLAASLLDEPLMNLDENRSRKAIELINGLAANATVIVAVQSQQAQLFSNSRVVRLK